MKVEYTVRTNRSYFRCFEAASNIGSNIFFILNNMPFWISARLMSKNLVHYPSLKISISANLSTIIIAAILAPSLCSASSIIIWTISNTYFCASSMFKHSLDILQRVSTPSYCTCSSELIIIFEIIGNTCSVSCERASNRGFSFWLIKSFVKRVGSFWKNYNFRNSYSVE